LALRIFTKTSEIRKQEAQQMPRMRDMRADGTEIVAGGVQKSTFDVLYWSSSVEVENKEYYDPGRHPPTH